MSIQMEKNTNSIDLLPGDITLNNIFTRLPSETVLHCKRVCKSWRNLLRSCKHFPYMHLVRQRELDDSKVSYILTCSELPNARGKFHLYYGDYRCNKDNAVESWLSTVVRVFHPPCPTYGTVLGSCNGLILYQPTTKTVYLFNPLTREYLDLPVRVELRVCGFGYDTSTGAYKVVWVDRCYDLVTRSKISEVRVYTIGSGIGWRRKENITPQLLGPKFGNFVGIPSNGALHWLDSTYRIWAFDLEDEEFRCIPSPQFQRVACDDFQLRLLGGYLSMVHYKNSRTIMDIWLLKKRKRSTSDSYSTVNEKLEYYQLSSWNWSKEFSLTEVLCEHHHAVRMVDPFALTKNGQLLLFCRTTTNIYRYTRSIFDKENLKNGANGQLYLYNAIPYEKSFVSLKDLGEDVKWM